MHRLSPRVNSSSQRGAIEVSTFQISPKITQPSNRPFREKEIPTNLRSKTPAPPAGRDSYVDVTAPTTPHIQAGKASTTTTMAPAGTYSPLACTSPGGHKERHLREFGEKTGNQTTTPHIPREPTSTVKGYRKAIKVIEMN